MHRQLVTCTVVLLLSVLPAQAADKEPHGFNSLTPQEIADGWILLFDGETTFGWKIEGEARIEDDVLFLGGDKLTKATATTSHCNFELSLDKTQLEGAREPRLTVDVGTADGLDLKKAKGSVGLGPPLDRRGWNTLKLKTEFGPPGSGGSVFIEHCYPDKPGGPGGKGSLVFTVGSGRITLGFEVPAGTKLALRDFKLRPLGLQSIFNGKDLTDWKVIPGHRSKFTVTDKGELNIKDGNGDIQTEGQWDDFVLQLEVISHGKQLNSGVFFRCLPGQFWSGYEAQIRNQWQGDDRTKAVDYGTGGIYKRQPARKVVSSDYEWFTMTVVAQGKHIATWVNGYQVTDFIDQRPLSTSARKGCKLDKGPISLQGHDPTTNLSFRNIRIAELPKASK